MITLEEACIIIHNFARSHADITFKISSISEFNKFWTFDIGPLGCGKMITGCIPAVDKKDGRVWGFFPPDWPDDGKGIPVPKMYELTPGKATDGGK